MFPSRGLLNWKLTDHQQADTPHGSTVTCILRIASRHCRPTRWPTIKDLSLLWRLLVGVVWKATAVCSQLIALPLGVSVNGSKRHDMKFAAPTNSSQLHRQGTLTITMSNDYVTVFLLTPVVDSRTMGLVRYTPLTTNQVNLLNCFLFQQLQLHWNPVKCRDE